MTDSQISVSASDLNREDAARARDLAQGVVVLPLRRTADGVGVYSQASVFLVKELRAEGVDAAYLDAPESRQFEVLESAVGTDLIQLAIGGGGGLLTNASWAALQGFFGRRRGQGSPDGPVELSVVDLSGTSCRQVNIRGSREDVLAIAEQLDLPRALTSQAGAGEADPPTGSSGAP